MIRSCLRQRRGVPDSSGTPRLCFGSGCRSPQRRRPVIRLLRLTEPSPSLALARLVSLLEAATADASRIILEAAAVLGEPSAGLPDLLDRTADLIRGLVVIQDGPRVLSAARPHSADADDLPAVFQPVPAPRREAGYTAAYEDRSIAACQIPLPVGYWDREMSLVAQRTGGGRLWRRRALDVLNIARHGVSNAIIEQHLSHERQRAASSTLLQQLIETQGHLTPAGAGNAEAANWRLSGWHIAVFFRPDGGTVPAAIIDRMNASFAELGLGLVPLIVHPPGLVSWISADDLDDLPAGPDLETLLREALQASEAPAITVRTGPQRRSSNGLVASILDSIRSTALTPAASVPTGSRNPGSNRMLALWHADDLVKEEAEAMLKPLAPHPELARTLDAYFAADGSAAETARTLRVHRNTVVHRIARIQELLRVDLLTPLDRLTLAAALHLVRPGDPPSAASGQP